MAENNKSRKKSIKTNDEEINSTTTIINPSASDVWKYFVRVKTSKYMCQFFYEKNPHYNIVMKRNGHSSTTKFLRHLEIFYVSIHDKFKWKKL